MSKTVVSLIQEHFLANRGRWHYHKITSPIAIDSALNAQVRLLADIVSQVSTITPAFQVLSTPLVGGNYFNDASYSLKENLSSFIKNDYFWSNEVHNNVHLQKTEFIGNLRNNELIGVFIHQFNEQSQSNLENNTNNLLLQSVLEALPGWKFRVTNKGLFKSFFPSNHDEGFIMPAEEFIGQNLSDLLPDYLTKAISSNINNCLSQKELQIFELALPAKGQMQYFELRFTPLGEEEVLLVVKNQTEQKIYETQLRSKMQELDQRNTELKKFADSNAQLENFAYIASHDLREPLRTMSNFAKLLVDRFGDELNDKAKTYVDFIVKGAGQMNRLIEDLLQYSRVNTQNHDISDIKTSDLLKETINHLQKSIEDHSALIEIGDLPDTIKGNPFKIGQIFSNLINNAIKFHKEGVPPHIFIEGKDAGEDWQFSVKDNGIGIKKEFQEQIFLLFKKLYTTSNYPGTGLGLAICEKIAEQHQGKIWVESDEGEGATFFFTIRKELP